MTPTRISIVTHNDPALTAPAIPILCRLAAGAGATVVASADEFERHDGATLADVESDQGDAVDLRICLGGDGTILRGLRASAGTACPVFGINFGEVGFLAACEPEEVGLERAFQLAIAGEFERLGMPALRLGDRDLPPAFNDICLQRRPGLRIADVAYSVSGQEIGRVRCDGVVLATPAGSTGYNLANGGPVVAWGVEGFAVSFIAPHSLTARALMVAPDDVVSLSNRSAMEPVDLLVDGRPVGELGPGFEAEVSFMRDLAVLAQLPGSSFYQRLREKFGRLAT